MLPDKFLRRLVQKRHPEKPGGRRELGPYRGDEARSIVPLMNREAPSGITPTNELGWNAGGITIHDGAAGPQLRLSQRQHGGAHRASVRPATSSARLASASKAANGGMSLSHSINVGFAPKRRTAWA